MEIALSVVIFVVFLVCVLSVYFDYINQAKDARDICPNEATCPDLAKCLEKRK